MFSKIDILKFSQKSSQGNICIVVYFLIKLQASNLKTRTITMDI